MAPNADMYGKLLLGGSPCGGCEIFISGPAELSMTADSGGNYDSLFYDTVLPPGTYAVFYPCLGRLIPTQPGSVTLAQGIDNYYDITIGFCG